MTEEQYKVLKAKVREYEGLHKQIKRLAAINDRAHLTRSITLHDDVTVIVGLEPKRDHQMENSEEAVIVEELVAEIKDCIDQYCINKITELRQVAADIKIFPLPGVTPNGGLITKEEGD